MSTAPTHPDRSSARHRRSLVGAAVLVVLVATAGLAAYLTRDGRTSSSHPERPTSSASAVPSPSATNSPVPSASGSPRGLPVPPSTHDPIVFGKAAAVALWSYDTRSYSQPEFLAAVDRWMTSETKYADRASVEQLLPAPVLWERMADQGQHATATADDAHIPSAFTQALQADPGALTTAYVYAVTVTGHQAIAWKGSPHAGAEARAITLAVQCRPDRPCALAGVLPNVAP
ncbi:hypothetical protein [Actinacidiphila sp. bgisy145]|uniref:hypothetical protein n=1 Tax=Actinacidiphila sp. bgisy145 TaxID=3413792 RepID=UPI003EBB40C3